jgi:hypothetical protein
MKKSKSQDNPFDICNSFGRLLSFGMPTEREVNTNFYDAMHFINTMEVQDP